MREEQLDRAFANRIASFAPFRTWVLAQTKFSSFAEEAQLLQEEQAQSRPRTKPENWWKHWWCRLDDGSESETDIFVVLSLSSKDKRIALHVENKPPHGRFTPDQAVNYPRRAEFMANKKRYLTYTEYACVLLAPQAFLDANLPAVRHFDSVLAYESIAVIIPEFAASLEEGAKKRMSRRSGC